MKNNGKKKVVIKNEETAENWCFVCKDGGDLRICDYTDCLKSYHPDCVGKEDSFLSGENYWACAWHICSICRKDPYVQCYTCDSAVCRPCYPASGFLQVNGDRGFCHACLKLALLIEEDQKYDSDGEKVDFTDRETHEGLFMEYYMIIKEEEGFELDDIYAAQDSLKMKKTKKVKKVKKKKNHQSESESQESDDYASDESDQSGSKKRKRRRCNSAVKPHKKKSNKKEFINGVSKSLMDFLISIGKFTGEKPSHEDVTSIVHQYVKENKLFHPNKPRKIVCDARLYALFKRRAMIKYRVWHLLEREFADESEEEEEEKCVKKTKIESEYSAGLSCFAAIRIENVKLVYLKRSVLNELVKEGESFEEKVVGCFVRVRLDSNDYRSRYSFQLAQVKGVKTVPSGENESEIALLLSATPDEIRISLVSDDDFSEEECEDLKRRVLAGEIEKLTVVDLQEKAKIVHKDITKHRINKELALLKNLIDRANEKGWRRELFEYLDKKKKLQNPTEQLRMLENVPAVIPEMLEDDSNKMDDDDDDLERVKNETENEKVEDLGSKMWWIQAPTGMTRECRASSLKVFESSSYASMYKVWREDQNECDAIGLLDAIRITSSSSGK